MADKNTSSHVPIMDINKVISDSTCNKVAERKINAPKTETILTPTENKDEAESKESSTDNKSEGNLNGKMMKFSESRKSPVIGFTPMTYHSTPNKEGVPLTKTMVDQQLHTNRHSDLSNVKKTIEVHTDSGKQKIIETPTKNKDAEDNKLIESASTENEDVTVEQNEKDITTVEGKSTEIANKQEDNVNVAQPAKNEEAKSDDKNVGAKVKSTDVLEKSTEKAKEQEVVIHTSEDVTEEKSKDITQVESINKVNSEVNIKDVVNTEKETEVKQVEIGKDKESNNIREDIVEQVIEVDELIEGKEEPMEIDDEIELTIAEHAPYVEENKVIVEDINKVEHKDGNFEEVTVENQEQDLVVDEPILIDDDDVSIVEEVIVESKDEKVNIPEHVSCDSKTEGEIVGTAIPENLLKSNEDSSKQDKTATKDTDSKDKENIRKEDSLLVDSSNCPESKDQSSSVVKTVEEKTANTSMVIEKATTKDRVSSSSITETEPVKDAICMSSTNSVNKYETKILQQESKTVTAKAPIDELRKPLKVSINEHDVKLIPSVDETNVSRETIKHNIPSKISPLLVTPKIMKETPPAADKIGLKKPNVQNLNVTSEHKIESKVLDTFSRKEPVNLVQVTESVPKVAKMPIDISSVPKTITPVVVKDKVSSKVVSAVDPQKKVIPQPVKNISIEKPRLETKTTHISHKDDKRDMKLPSKEASEKGKGVINIEITKVPRVDPAKTNVAGRQDVSSSSGKHIIPAVKNKSEAKDKREPPIVAEPKPINNNHSAVPFGKWTDANRQEFLNKFKTKASVSSSSSNQLKNSNDLNRRDVLKKIDSQRQSNNALSKTQEANKLSMKSETPAFSNKPNIMNKEVNQEPKNPQRNEAVEVKSKAVAPKNIAKTEVAPKIVNEPGYIVTTTNMSNKESCQRTGVVQNLIDKTIEGMIHRSAPTQKTQDEPKPSANKEPSAPKPTKTQQTYPIEQATLDAIEMKMNELHGIPFIERPPHELPKVNKPDLKSYSKIDKEKPVPPTKTKIPNLLPFLNKTQQKVTKDTVIEVDSEDEIIEHEPITGDINLHKKNQVVKLPAKDKAPNITQQIQQAEKPPIDASVKDAIITEKDFDKFARRNSITYENRLTVNFDGKEPHNVVQTVVAKDPPPKSYSRNDASRMDSKAKLPLNYKYQNVRQNTQSAKVHSITKFGPSNDDASTRNQSKLQKAYHSALTAKQQMADTITIIEDKPVQVLFIDNADYVPSQLNVQGQDLSPAKRKLPETDIAISTCDSLDSDILDDDAKAHDDTKTKTKHQRKQVLTPVDEPELELIEPSDLGIEVSPKKKRRTDEDKTDKNVKYPMRKKFYMLSSSAVTEEKLANPVEITKNPLKETVNLNDNGVAHKNPVSALDSLVKAAELIETQTENINTSIVSNPDNQPTTPVKRGRGRPRKYPITPDGTDDKSKVTTRSPVKKPRLIDAKAPKHDTTTDDSDSEGEIIKENWTMGKINENIVCPICNKLFRTENVVFKHVKHCTGPSPSRSDSDKRSPRRMRISQDFDTKSQDSKSDDMDIDDDKPLVMRKETPKKRKSKDSITKSDDKDDIIVIEDTPVKEKLEKVDERKHHESRKPRTKIPHKTNDLVCEFCGKTFRQLSYLVSHKLQHKKQEKVEPKKTDKDAPAPNKSVYSCEVCKKEFRKLHHLVQHRIIHNPSSVPARSLRKSSSEQSESKIEKEPSTSKQSDDPSAGFRCEPCDKSFRKLHHLVEHRETHDGQNRQKSAPAPQTKEDKPAEKPAMLHQCDICKKTFRKLQHLTEHREQHVETSSEKSDDKSVKSSLSTRDIIHECSLCYMVFPNEHSLNKHTIICQRKKRQSKQVKPTDETEGGDEVIESPTPEEKVECLDTPKPIFEHTKTVEKKQEVLEKVELVKDKSPINEIEEPKVNSEEAVKDVEKEKNTQKLETKSLEQQVLPAKRDFVATEIVKTEPISEVPVKIKKIEEKESKIHETPKKKTPLKDKTATKRHKSMATPTTVTEEVKTAVESSDDDEVRYMLNPNFKSEDVSEEKVFMKVRAKKRSSLQIERPNSKDLVKRRTSLQHPPKIPRLKAKVVETNTATVKKEIKTPKLEPVPSTDSDDSETTKYSFPSTIPEKPIKPAQDRTPKDSERKIQKKSLADKRKSLSGIAKRKSLGKVITAKHKVTPLKPVKKSKYH